MVHMFFGGDTMSWLRFICLKSFTIQYPDIELILWKSKEWAKEKTWNSEEQQDFTTTNGVDYFPEVEKLNITIKEWEQPDEVTERFGLLDPVHQADIFRYHILSTVGGYFSDTDVLFLDNSLKPILNKSLDLCVYYGDYPIGFIGGKGKGSRWGEIYQACLKSTDSEYQSFGASLIKQVWFTPPKDFINLGKDVFYHYDHHMIYALFARELPTDHLSNIHMYLGGGLSQIYNRILTGENYTEYPCTVINAIKELLND